MARKQNRKVQLQLETLEDRCLLAAGLGSVTAAMPIEPNCQPGASACTSGSEMRVSMSYDILLHYDLVAGGDWGSNHNETLVRDVARKARTRVKQRTVTR